MKHFILTNRSYVTYVESVLSMYDYKHSIQVIDRIDDPRIDPENDVVVMYMYNKIVDPDSVRFLANCHPSLFPKHKGSAPQVFSFADNDVVHGWTIHTVTAKIDDGDVLDIRTASHKPINGYDLWMKQFDEGLLYLLGTMPSMHTMFSKPKKSDEGQANKMAQVNKMNVELDRDAVRQLLALQYAGFSPRLDDCPVLAFKLAYEPNITVSETEDGNVYSFKFPKGINLKEMAAVCRIEQGDIDAGLYESGSLQDCVTKYEVVIQYYLHTKFLDLYRTVTHDMGETR